MYVMNHASSASSKKATGLQSAAVWSRESLQFSLETISRPSSTSVPTRCQGASPRGEALVQCASRMPTHFGADTSSETSMCSAPPTRRTEPSS